MKMYYAAAHRDMQFTVEHIFRTQKVRALSSYHFFMDRKSEKENPGFEKVCLIRKRIKDARDAS